MGSPPPARADRSSHRRRLLTATLQTLCVYLFAGWAYVAVIAVFRPGWLAQPLWHDISWLRRDTFAAVAFAGSFVCYVLLQWVRLRRPAERRGSAGLDPSRPRPRPPGRFGSNAD